MAQIGGRNVATNELGIMGGALLTLIFSFFTWFSFNFHGIISDVTRNGWGSGFTAWFPILLSIAAGALIAAKIFGNVQLPALQVGWNFLVFAATAVALVLLLLKLAIGYHSFGRGIGLFLGIIAVAVQTYFAFAAFKVSGEALPGGRKL